MDKVYVALQFLLDNWNEVLGVLLFLYEYFANKIPTEKDITLLGNIRKILNFFVTNKRKDNPTDVVAGEDEKKNVVEVKRNRHLFHTIILLMVASSVFAQVGTEANVKSVNLKGATPSVYYNRGQGTIFYDADSGIFKFRDITGWFNPRNSGGSLTGAMLLGVDNIGPNTYLFSDAGSQSAYIGLSTSLPNNDIVNIGWLGGSQSMDFNIGRQGASSYVAEFTDNRTTPIGFTYNADYSATFTNESLITKRYVTTQLATKITNPMTTALDLIIGGVSGAATRLAVGINDGVLKVNSTGTGVGYGKITAANVTAGSFTYSLFTNAAGLSVVGRSAGTSGVLNDITASTPYNILRYDGSIVDWGAIDLSQTGAIGTSRLAYSNLAQGSALSVLGVTGNATANNASITGTADQVIRANGAGTAVAFGSIDLSKSAAVGTSILAAPNGGTGQSSFAVGDLLSANTTTSLSKVAAVAAGSYLRSAGTSTLPVWSTLILPNAATVNQLVFASSTNTYGASANLTYDGTIFNASGRITTGSNNLTAAPLTVSYGGTTGAVNVTLAVNTSGGVTIRNTSSEINSIFSTGNGITTGANTQTVRGYYNGYTLTANHTGAGAFGFIHNPTIAGTFASGVTNLAFAGQAGSQMVIGALTPTANIQFDMISTTLAFRPPTMSTTQRNAITGAEGMLVYNNVTHTLDHYNGTTWGALASGGISGLTINRIPYATSSTAIGDDAGLTYDATNDIVTSRFQASPTATLEGLNIGSVASDPSAPTNGGIWRNSANDVLKWRGSTASGTTFFLPNVTAAVGANRIQFGGSVGNYTFADNANLTYDPGTSLFSTVNGKFTSLAGTGSGVVVTDATGMLSRYPQYDVVNFTNTANTFSTNISGLTGGQPLSSSFEYDFYGTGVDATTGAYGYRITAVVLRNNAGNYSIIGTNSTTMKTTGSATATVTIVTNTIQLDVTTGLTGAKNHVRVNILSNSNQ